MSEASELLRDTPATRPCTHRRANHEHGSEGRYSQDGCRCLPCRTAHEAYRAAHPPTVGHGGHLAFADAAQAREHVNDLISVGLSWKTVAARAGLSEETVKALLYGRKGTPVTRVRARTARQLLAVQAGRRRMPQPPDLLTTEATS